MDEVLIKRRFGANVRQAREAKDGGLTQDQLAEAVGVSRTSITGIELGNQNVNLQTLYKLAKALDVEPWSLLPGHPASRDGELTAKAASLRTLVEKLRQQLKQRGTHIDGTENSST